MSELIKCSKCRCNKLPGFFTVKRTTGQRFKTCDTCRARKFTCDQCDATFSQNSSLTTHIRGVHENVRPFSCEQCESKFLLLDGLERHVKAIHDQIRDQQCPQCDFKSSDARNLVTHINVVHNLARDHQCPHCESKFGISGTLQMHIKTVHNQIRDHECPHCDKKFAHTGTLNVHISMVHNQARDHACEQCEAKFSSLQNLNHHIKSLHDQIRDNECPNCDFKSSRSRSLLLHMKVCTGRESMSSGEFAIKGILEAMNIPYQREMRFSECKNVLPLPFDFYLPQQVVAIEFDGKQHFEPIEHFGGQEGFESTQRRDAIKNAYCLANNIRLLRIPYTDFERVQELIEAFIAPPIELSLATLSVA